MTLLIFLNLLSAPALGDTENAQAERLIGRCSFDPLMLNPEKGDYRAGQAIASFYLSADAEGNRRVVASESLATSAGFLTDRSDPAPGAKRYDVFPVTSKFPAKMEWITDEARARDPEKPVASEIGFSGGKGALESYPARGSFLQNVIVNQINAYPTCLFWEWL